MDIEQLQYPIGKFEYGKSHTVNEVKEAIELIKALPKKLEKISQSLSPAQLEQTYRPGAWTALQLINHLADVYINAFLRTKWILTEENPVIKTYDENAFAALPDGSFADLRVALSLVSNLLQRWTYLLASIPESDYSKCLIHPEYGVKCPLDELIVMYAWHGNHHLAHLEIIKNADI